MAKIYPYKAGSQSAKALAQALNIKQLKQQGDATNFKKHVVINWGRSKFDRKIDCLRVLNRPDQVALATNKLSTFIMLDEKVSIPAFTERRGEAADWIAEGASVVERHKLTGHSGEGIRIVEKIDDLQEAPLYVKYIPKLEEYRLHVFAKEVFFIQRKARKQDVPDDQVNWKVRNHGNGFIYAHKDVDVDQRAKDEAVKAITALDLDFGAVDIIYNKKQDKFYVLEVNTACGLEGTTLEKYVEQFKKVI